MIGVQAPLGQEFLYVAIRQREAQIPTDRKENHLRFKLAPLEQTGNRNTEHPSILAARLSGQAPKVATLPAMERLHRVIQVKTVELISILALARKFIILNIEATPALTIVALGFAVIALGVVYWLMRERDDRSAGEAKSKPSAIQ